MSSNPVNANTGAVISLNTAAQWTANYRSANPNQVKAHGFGMNIINQVLDQEGCIGIRIYYAISDSGEKTLVVVGIDGAGNDMENGVLADFSAPCPASCSVGTTALSQ